MCSNVNGSFFFILNFFYRKIVESGLHAFQKMFEMLSKCSDDVKSRNKIPAKNEFLNNA